MPAPDVPPIIVADVKARAIRERGPRGPHDGAFYWRAELGRRTIWTGWGTVEEATRAILEVVSHGVEGVRPRVAGIRTVRDLLATWLGTVVDQREYASLATRRAIRGDLDPRRPEKKAGGAVGRLVRGLGDVQLDRLTVETVGAFVGARRAASKGTLTLLMDLDVLARAWTWGRGIGATPDHPLPQVAVPRRHARERRTPTPEEVALVLEWIAEHSEVWVYAALHLQAATGARVSEIGGLTWDRVDLDRRTIRVEGKTGPRTVHVPQPGVLELVDALPRKRLGVWGVQADTAAHEIGVQLRAAVRALELPAWSSHGFRRLAVDTMARRKVDPAVAAALTGHTVAVMWASYRQVTEQDKREAAAEAALGVPVPASRRTKVVRLGAHRSAHNSDENDG